MITMIILIGLIVLGSLIMVNLIVAIIISDIEWLNKISKEQCLINQVFISHTCFHVFQIFPPLRLTMLCKYSPCNHCFSVCLTDSVTRKLSGKGNYPERQNHKEVRDQVMNIVEGKQIIGKNKGKYYLNLNSVEAI